MIEQVLTQLKSLKLAGMAQTLQSQCEQSGTYEDLSFHERLGFMLDNELLTREQRKQQRLLNDDPGQSLYSL